MRRPPLSIGLPVYNGQKYLQQTLECLLNQTYGDFEIVITDNASFDGTEAICRRYAASDRRVRYFRSDTNRGAAWNFNEAFRLAQGDYFKWAAHDDIYSPTFLQACVGLLDSDPTCVLAFCETEFIDADGIHIRDYDHPINYSRGNLQSILRGIVAGGYIVVEIFGVLRSDLLKKSPLIGPYYGSDRVLLSWLALRGSFRLSEQRLFKHREHSDRSAHAHRSAAEYTTWFDSTRRSKIVYPSARLFAEHAKNVLTCELAAGRKISLMKEIGRAAYWSRQDVTREILDGVRGTSALLRSRLSRR